MIMIPNRDWQIIVLKTKVVYRNNLICYHSKNFNGQFNVYHWSHTKLFLIDFIPKISSALAVTTWHSGQVQKEAYLKEKSMNPFLTNVG